MMTEEEKLAALDGELLDALTKIAEGGLVTKYVVVFESVGDDGMEWLHARHSPGMAPWVLKGLLVHALDAADDEEDDE